MYPAGLCVQQSRKHRLWIRVTLLSVNELTAEEPCCLSTGWDHHLQYLDTEQVNGVTTQLPLFIDNDCSLGRVQQA